MAKQENLPAISLKKAIAFSLGEYSSSFILDYQLGRLIYDLYFIKRHFKNFIVDARPAIDESRIYLKTKNYLLNKGFLTLNQDVAAQRGFNILGKTTSTPQEMACLIDPFCAISHLSAMVIHGLTDRIPQTLFVVTPNPGLWSEKARGRMESDLDAHLEHYLKTGFPPLRRHKPDKLKGVPLSIRHSDPSGAFKQIGETQVRVVNVGQTFLDMVKCPDLCGGIYHVVEVYEQFAKPHLDLIVSHVERKGATIDKIRVGYLLDEVCNLSHPVISAWRSDLVQRGGSRKMLPDVAYSEHYSSQWALSLNHL